jgi:hypothetical protein
VFETARVEAAVRRLDGEQALGLAGVAGVGALIVLGSVVSPRRCCPDGQGGAARLFVTHVDWAILLVVASAPLEGAFASGPAGISVTKLAGGSASPLSCTRWSGAAANRLRTRPGARAGVARDRAPLDRLGRAILRRDYHHHALRKLRGDLRDHHAVRRRPCPAAPDRRTLTITCSIAAALGINEYLNGSEQLATLKYAQQNDFAFILATSLPFMFFLLGRTRALRPAPARRDRSSRRPSCFSLSRGAFVGLAAGFVLFVLTDRRRLQVTLTAGLVAAVGTLIVIHSNPQRFQQSLVLKQQVAQQNVSTRFGAWSAAARLATDHPLLGVGPGNFSSTTTPSPASRSGRSR